MQNSDSHTKREDDMQPMSLRIHKSKAMMSFSYVMLKFKDSLNLPTLDPVNDSLSACD